MKSLSLTYLGPFQASLGSVPLKKFRSNRTQALLIYLTVECKERHRREAIMTRLWPDLPQKSAQVNLRQVLYQLRGLIPEVKANDGETAVPFLLTDRHTVQIHPQAIIDLDIVQFERLLRQADKTPNIKLLEQAVDLYRGDFLADFYLPDSAPFEEWANARRGAYQRQVLDILQSLAALHIESKQFEAAETAVRRQLAIDPLRDVAHRQLIELLARSGRRSDALAHYDLYCGLLEDELGVEPATATLLLHQQIASGHFDAASTKKLRGYVLGAEIGRGTFGIVYRAQQPAVGREVAIKIIAPQYADQPEFIRRFEAEAQLVARLEHPHIVPLYEYWREPDGAYLVMQYLRGGSLADLLKAGACGIETAVSIMNQIVAALTIAHKQGVIHRDIKPSNILLDEAGNAYLSDFGIAKDLVGDPELTLDGVLIGSPQYSSPEQLRQEPVSAQTDIYSLGVMLFEMLTGQPPFIENALVTLVNRHLNDPLPLVQEQKPALPETIDAVIQKATAKQPADRFPTAQAFIEALRGFAFQPIASTPLRRSIPDKPLLHNLPSDPTPFIGRESELDELATLLSDPDRRLVTIIGAGGMGKTRLAIAVAHRLVSHHDNQAALFADGVYFVSLAGAETASQILPAIADALAIPDGVPVPQYLRRRHLLLLLDNFEQLLDNDGHAEVVALLETAVHLTILTTSREPLRIRQEQRYVLDGLTFPHTASDDTNMSDFAAMQLFIDSAQRLDTHYAIGTEEKKHLVQICKLVEGMPLALELAAGWTEMMSLAEIADEIARSIHFLETDMRDVPARHRSIYAVITGSWQRLSDEMQMLFAQLCVFRNGFSPEAAADVAAAVPRPLLRLKQGAWLQQNPENGRYHIHRLLWQFGQEQLLQNSDLAHETQQRHAFYFCDFLMQQEKGMLGVKEAEALRNIEQDEGNCRAAWRWLTIADEVARMEQGFSPLATYYARRSRPAAMKEDTQLAIIRLEGMDNWVAKRLLALILFIRTMFGDGEQDILEVLERSAGLLQEAAAQGVDVRLEKARLLRYYISSGVDLRRHDGVAKMEQRCAESVALFRDVGGLKAKSGEADVILRLGDKLSWVGMYAQAHHYLSRSLALFQELNSKSAVAINTSLLGFNEALSGNLLEGERLLQQSLALRRELDQMHLHTAAGQYFQLGLIVSWGGRFTEAAAHFAQATKITRNLGMPNFFSLPYQAYTAAHLGQSGQIKPLIQQELALHGNLLNPFNRQETESAQGFAALLEGDYEQAKALHQPVVTTGTSRGNLSRYTENVTGLVLAERGLGNQATARQLVQMLLHDALARRVYVAGITALALLALFLVDEGEVVSGTAVYKLARTHPFIGNSHWFQQMIGQPIDSASANLSLAEQEEVETTAQSMELWDLLATHQIQEEGHV